MGFSFEYEITDISEEIKKAVREQIIAGLTRIGMALRGYAAGKAPKRTGRLQESIAYQVDPDDSPGPSVTVGTNLEYAPYVEFGTGAHSEVDNKPNSRFVYTDPETGETRISKGQTPQHFIKPALFDHIPEYKEIMQDALSGESDD